MLYVMLVILFAIKLWISLNEHFRHENGMRTKYESKCCISKLANKNEGSEVDHHGN